MNRIYRTLWSVATQSWQAVPETAKTAGKKSKSSAGGAIASVALSWMLTGVASAQAPPAINKLPTGGTVARGTATINQTATAQAAAMTVNQTSQRAVVNWNTFNIGSNASVNFVQPNAQAVTLNRVSDANPSQIFGRMTSNGQVVLTNANGIYFAPGSSVDVGAITATTHRITDDNFMSGKHVFERNGATGKIINEGNITAALAGYVTLLAPEVQNAGVVVARAGTVAMAAGETITLNIDGAGSLAGISTTPSAIATLIENKQAVQAPDGQIILSAVALNKLQAGVIKNSGSLEANSLVSKGGKIVLEADDITLTATSKLEAKGATGGGTVLVGGDWQGSGNLRQATKVTMEAGASIDASATDKGDGGKVVLWSDIHNANSVTRANGSIKAEAGPNGGDGGQIETSGHYLNVEGIQVSTQSTKGNAGEWLLDPYDITISSAADATTSHNLSNGIDDFLASVTGNVSVINTSTLQSALAANNVRVYTGALGSAGSDSGNINVISDITWSSSNYLWLGAANKITGTGRIDMTGLGAKIKFAPEGVSAYDGLISGVGGLDKNAFGVFTLNALNTYSGGTYIGAGVLKAGSATAFGTGDITVTYATTLDLNGQNMTSLGTLRLGGFAGRNNLGALTNSVANTTGTYAGPVIITDYTKMGGVGKILLSSTSPLTSVPAGKELAPYGAGGTIASSIATGTLWITEGDWSLSGNSTYTGYTKINAGSSLTITDSGSLGNGSYAGSITNNGTLKYSSTADQLFSGTLSGSGVLIKDTSSTSALTLSGNNTYSGATTITAGILRAASNNALGDTSAGTTIGANGILEIGNPASPSNIALSPETLTIDSGGTVHNVAGMNTHGGSIVFNGNTTIAIDTNTSLNFSAFGSPNYTMPVNSQLRLNLDGDLTFGKSLMANTNATYYKTGSGNFQKGIFSTLQAATPVYIGLYDASGNYSSVYGDTPNLTAAVFSNATGQTLLSNVTLQGTATWTGTVPTSTSAVTPSSPYSISYAGGLTMSSLYAYAGPVTTPHSWTITAKPLTITPTVNQSKYYGDADATLTYTTSGMVGNDTLSGALARAAGESVGSYAYSITGMSATNYALTLAAGADQFAINQRPITITPASLRKTYGNADPTFTASITSGSLASVTASDSLTDVIAGLSRTSGESAGSYDVVLTRGPKASSYLITYVTNNQAFTIDPSTNVVTKPYVPAIPILMATAGATSIPAQALSQLNTDQLSALRSNAAPAPLVQMSQRTATPNEPVVIVPPQPTAESAPRTGVLPVTILQSTNAKPANSGVAFEQTEDAVSLKITTAPAVVVQAPKLAVSDKLTSFTVSLPTGDVVVYECGLVNNRLVIVATSTHAKRVARNDLKLVLSTAINSLGKDNRVMLDKLKSVLLDLR